MIFGVCPYDDCAAPLSRGLVEHRPLPVMERHACEGCGRIVWTRHSRVDPASYTEAQFQALGLQVAPA